MSMSQISEKAFEQIKFAMSLDEVEAILGRGSNSIRPILFPGPLCSSDCEEWFWDKGDFAIAVIIDRKSGRVEATHLARVESSTKTPVSLPSVEW